MATRTDESPPRQQDRDVEPSRGSSDDVRRVDTDAVPRSADSDTAAAWTDDPDINTQGSER